MNELKCNFCKKIFSTKQTLGVHQNTSKFCLKIQNKSIEGKNKCIHCNKSFTRKERLSSHLKICKSKKTKDFEIILKDKINEEKISYLENELKKRIYLPPSINSKIFTLKGVDIIQRNEDGFINLTALLKAGKKDYFDWKQNKKTEPFLKSLSSTMRIPYSEIIIKSMDINGIIHTWGHPMIAINIAQWISSKFYVEISKWIFENKERKGDEKLIEELSGHHDLIKEESQLKIPEFKEFKLTLSDGKEFLIPMRKDGYVNATLLCKASGKRIDNWMCLETTKKLHHEFFNSLGSQGVKSLDCLQGKYGGTFIHPDLAVQLAQWISPSFALQVSRWIREIMLTGRVELGNEKTNEELEMIQEQRLSIGIEPYLTNDVTYIFEFIPEKEHLKNPNLLDDINIHYFEIGVTSDIKDRKKAYSGYKLLKVFVYSSRQKAAMAESYMKNIVVELNMTLEYKNKKECMYGTYEELDRFIEIITEHNLNGNKEPEDDKNSSSVEIYKIQTDKEIEMKRIEMEIEIQKNKQNMIMSLFERKLITFEQFNESMKNI